MNLFLDYETRSDIDLKKCGMYVYAEHPSTQILMLGWAIDDEPVQIYEPHCDLVPSALWEALRDPYILKVAFNAAFERLTTKHKLGRDVPIREWRDVQAMARYLSLPGSLDAVCSALRLEEGKDPAGKKLIALFSKPAPKTFRQRFRDWNTHPKEWEQFKAYCRRDTLIERELYEKFSTIDFPESELNLWFLSEEINDRGIPVSSDLPAKGRALVKRERDENIVALRELTGLWNPNSDSQLLEWAQAHGYPYGSLQKPYVAAALASAYEPELIQALELRQKLSRRSYTKIQTLLQSTSADGRLRGQFKFMGAARTGRWSGGGVQVQNFARPVESVKKNLEATLDAIHREDYDCLRANHPSVMDAVVSSMRSFFETPVGKKFIAADLNAIEPRVLGWVSGDEKINKIFENGLCPYISFGVSMFNEPYEKLNAEYKSGNEKRRQLLKPAVLGCGYALGGGLLYMNQFGDEVKGGLWSYAANMGVEITQDFAHDCVKVYRETYSGVKRFWKACEEAFKFVLRHGGREYAGVHIFFTRLPMKSGGCIVRCHLPSGRCLHYFNPKIEMETVTGNDGNPWTREQISYEGIEHSAQYGVGGEKLGAKIQWDRAKTYGGKLTENIVQAISRDVLAQGMMLADAHGMKVVGHFHDEIMVEAGEHEFGPSYLCDCMSAVPPWAPGLRLEAEGWEGKNYRK